MQAFIQLVGEPLLPDGKRRTLTIMAANEGVMDLLLNLLCSAKYAGDVDLSSFIVFVAQPEYVPVVESMGVKAFHHRGLGYIPKQAADFYADPTFARIMWLKMTAVYIVLSCGFNSLFQDTDVVWLKSPAAYLETLEGYDAIFMVYTCIYYAHILAIIHIRVLSTYYCALIHAYV